LVKDTDISDVIPWLEQYKGLTSETAIAFTIFWMASQTFWLSLNIVIFALKFMAQTFSLFTEVTAVEYQT